MSADTFTIMNILNITGNITSVTETPATHHNLLRFQYILFVYVLSVIIASGVIGNVLSIAVLSQPRMMSTTAIYLISLAVFDTFVLICTLCSFTLPMNEYFRDEVYPYIHPHVYYLALVSQMGSIYTTLAFTLERFMAVCYPMRLENIPTKSRTIKIIVLIVAFVMTYNIPRWFEFRMVQTPNDDNTTSVTYEVTKFGQNSSYKKGYLNCAYFLFMFGIPFLSLFCLNLRLMITIRNSRLSRRALSRTRGAHDSYLTAFLFAIVSVFFFCQLPALVDNIIWSCLSDADLSSERYVIFTGISNTMVNVNSAVNFLFYCCVGKKFRQVFREIVCCHNAESDDTLYTTRSSARSTHSRNESSRRPRGHNAFSLMLFSHRGSNNKRSDELQNSAKKRANFDRKDDGELINLCDLKINGIEPNAVLLNRRSLAPKGFSGQKAAKYITMSGHEHNMDCEV